MDNYVIITDSTCDLSDSLANELDLHVQPLTFIIEDKEYKNYLDEREMNLSDFYNQMRKGMTAKTAQLNIIDIENYFRPYLEKGLDILNICFSSGLSGTYNAMNLAKDELLEEFPDRKIIIIDSLNASTGEGLLAYNAALNKKNGMSLDDNAKCCLELKNRIKSWFIVDDLDTLKRGGRLSGATAFAAKLLNIKPVLKVNETGHLENVFKKRGRKASINQMVESSMENIDVDYKNYTFISHADCLDEALIVKDKLQEKFNELNIKSEIVISKIGPVIGAHAGPGTIAIFTVVK